MVTFAASSTPGAIGANEVDTNSFAVDVQRTTQRSAEGDKHKRVVGERN